MGNLSKKQVSLKTEEIFNKWLFQVCQYLGDKHRKDISDIYSSIDLTDARCQFMDGLSPQEYNNVW